MVQVVALLEAAVAFQEEAVIQAAVAFQAEASQVEVAIHHQVDIDFSGRLYERKRKIFEYIS